jgi:hypothetical protein
MPRLTGNIGRYGPMTNVKVMLSTQRVEALKKLNLPYAPPQTVIGLIDTGASCSAIDVHLAKGLGLERRGVTHIHTPSTGSNYETRTTYDACYVIGEGQPKALLRTLSVIECELASEGFYVIVGRDVLEDCVFTYNGPKARFSLKY